MVSKRDEQVRGYKASHLLGSDNGTLVVGDVHISAGQNVSRADLLGKAINILQPKRVLFIGDLMTFDCFSEWDKDKRKKMEGRRYSLEIAKGREFLERVRSHSRNHEPEDGYLLCEGNHEDRVRRYIDSNPELDGALNYLSDIGFHGRVIPYKEYYKIAGVDFTHVPINEAGKPIGGKYAVHRALDLHEGSVVFGHTHKLATASMHRHGSAHLSQALNVGCFFEHIDEYAVGSVTSYWRGLVFVDHYKNGRFGWTPISMGKLKKQFN